MNWWVLRRKIHSSWLIAFACAGIVLGVIVAQYIPQTWFAAIAWLLVSVGLLAIGFWRRTLYIVPTCVLAGCLLGLWRGSIDMQARVPYERLQGQQLRIEGRVSEDVERDIKANTLIRLNDIHVMNHSLPGAMWVSARTDVDIKRGDVMTVEGRLSEGFGSFATSMYQANLVRIERPEPGDIAREVRDNFADKIRLAIDEPAASLGLGYLVGQRRGLPPELDEALKIAGLTHIVVASGYNLTILVRLARRLLSKVSKYLGALSAGAMILSFVAITGMSPSMSRAGLVAGLSLLAWYYGRKFHPAVLLSFVAAITLLLNPSYGWNDLGWQLSFAAFVGVMIVAPLMQRYFFGDKKPGTVRQILGETVSAQLVTLPILVLAFGQFSNLAIVANLLVLPLVPLAMLLTFIVGLGVLIVPALATIIGAPAEWLLRYMIIVAEQLAALPWAQTELVINGWVVTVFYVILAVFCVYVWRQTRYDLRRSNIVE
jgi:competence protein ComEC